jgi:adenylosuccinate synthase
MNTKIIVLSGRVCSGKSSLAERLKIHLDAHIVSTSELIFEVSSVKPTNRVEFQEAGDALDKKDGGQWVADGLSRYLLKQKIDRGVVVLDSVRIPEQLVALRRAFGGLMHVHLTAKPEVLELRYQSRLSNMAELGSYKEVEKNSTEKTVDRITALADVVIGTDRCSADDVYTRVSARIAVRPGIAAACVDVLIGGQYGSEGKGNIASYLAPEYDVLVRVGGPNAGHKVFQPNVEPYTFHQLPSGAISNKEAKLIIGAGAVISLNVLMREIKELKIPNGRLFIDGQAILINEEDMAWEEKNLKDTIASTAQGVGSATSRKISGRGTDPKPLLARGVEELEPYICDTVELFGDSLSKGQRIMLEGTQGTGLSLHHGSYPHVTSRITTAPGCLAEAGLAARHVRKVVMVCRTYPIRVGNTDTGNTSGEMLQEIDIGEISRRSQIPLHELENTERTSTTNRPRRIAEFDWAQFRRSIVLNGPTDIALTFADYLHVSNRVAYRYERLTDHTLRFVEELEKVGGLPVSLISTDFSDRNIIDRRAWSAFPYQE